MNWIANVFVNDIRYGETFNIFPFPADSEADAARWAADAAAKKLFGEYGQSTFVNQIADQPLYKANVGLYQGAGVTKGKSLSILIRKWSGK